MILHSKILISISVILFISCQNKVDNQSCDIPINPNGDSELSILMRDMIKDSEQAKKQIELGEKPNFLINYEKLHSAKATDPKLRENGSYTNLSNAYLASIKNLKESDDLYEEKYNNLIQECVNCHMSFCPGLIKRIKKLKIK